MQKTQINYRIDEGLLQSIKIAAKKEGIPYTQWITKACEEKLHPSRKMEVDRYRNIYEEMAEKLYVELYDQLYEKLYNQLSSKLSSKTNRDNQVITKGINNAELARLLKVNPATTSRWSTGNRQPPKNLDWEFNTNFKLWYQKGNN